MRQWPNRHRAIPQALLAVVIMMISESTAAEINPFLPPAARQAELDQHIQKRVDRAVEAMEQRLMDALINALEGKATGGPLPQALHDALRRRGAEAVQAGPLPPGLPGIPALPSPTNGMGGPVPSGAVFIGCLDGQAFFQDRTGTPILVDPRAFPPSGGGAAACAP